MSSLQYHPSKRLVAPGGESVDIDVEMVPMIRALWAAGYSTASCCQDVGESLADCVASQPHLSRTVEYETGYAAVDLMIPDGLELLTAVARAGPRDDFYRRMSDWSVRGAWASSIPVLDIGDLCDAPSEFDVCLMRIAFPRTDIAQFARRIRTSLRGRSVVVAQSYQLAS